MCGTALSRSTHVIERERLKSYKGTEELSICDSYVILWWMENSDLASQPQALGGCLEMWSKFLFKATHCNFLEKIVESKSKTDTLGWWLGFNGNIETNQQRCPAPDQGNIDVFIL